MASALTPIARGAFGFIGVWVGAALAVPFLIRAVAETQKVRTRTATVAVSAPVLLYSPHEATDFRASHADAHALQFGSSMTRPTCVKLR
jgi:hypothetical protein